MSCETTIGNHTRFVNANFAEIWQADREFTKSLRARLPSSDRWVEADGLLPERPALCRLLGDEAAVPEIVLPRPALRKDGGQRLSALGPGIKHRLAQELDPQAPPPAVGPNVGQMDAPGLRGHVENAHGLLV